MSSIFGVDVSSNNGSNIDWAAAHSAGVRVAYVKATQATNYRSPTYQAQVTGARAAGIAVGAYHFSEPASTSPGAAYAYFAAYAATTPTDLPPMVDDETAGGLSWSALRAWMQAWLALAGPGALHYSNGDYLQNLGPLGRQWTARPGATGIYGSDFATQVSLGSPLAGFPGSVDLDYFNSAILGTPRPQPSPPPEEIKVLIVFYAKTTHGVDAAFVGDGAFFRWIESPAQLADVLAVGAVVNGKAVSVWNAPPAAPVKDPMAFGAPANAATAAQLGLAFP